MLRWTWALATALALSGCVQSGMDAIDHARNATADTTPATPSEQAPQESVQGSADAFFVNTTTDGPTGASPDITSPTPAVSPTPAAPAPAPAPTPSATPASSPSPTPAPTAAPTPAPTAAPSPTPAPTPSPSPTPAPVSWPTEGSTVSYTVETGKGFPNYGEEVYANATWRYHDGDWRGACDAQVYEQIENGDGTWRYNNSTFHVDYTPANPPHWPLFDPTHVPAVGGNVTVWTMEGCTIVSETMVYAGVFDNATWGRVHGAHDTDEAEQYYSHFSSAWRPDTGLVDEWFWGRLHSYSMGHLTALT